MIGSRMGAPWLVVVLVTLGCASSGKTAACEPVPVERWAGLAQVFSECEVDVKARLQTAPKVEYSGGTGEQCASAELDVVVDTLGQVVRNSAIVVRATNKAFADAVIAASANARFTPARRQGVAVAQVHRYGAAMTLMLQVVAIGRASSQASRREPSAPRC